MFCFSWHSIVTRTVAASSASTVSAENFWRAVASSLISRKNFSPPPPYGLTQLPNRVLDLITRKCKKMIKVGHTGNPENFASAAKKEDKKASNPLDMP